MITKEDFLKKAELCFIEKSDYMRLVNIALEEGLIDLEKEEPDFRAVYPLATAIYEKETRWYIEGCPNESERRRERRKANGIRKGLYYADSFYDKDGNRYS